MSDNLLLFPKSKTKSTLRIGAKSGSDIIQMDMFGVVGGDWWGDGGITKETFAKELKNIPSSCKTVNVQMSSPGGDVHDGRAIANMIQDHRCVFNINVIAECCSIATIIAMGGDTIHMSEGSVFLVHHCYSIVMGNANELRNMAKELDLIDQEMIQTYKKKTKMKEQDLLNLLDENRYMNSEEAKKLGFVDSIANEKVDAGVVFKIAALDIDRKKFHLPPLPLNARPRYQAAMAALKRM